MFSSRGLDQAQYSNIDLFSELVQGGEHSRCLPYASAAERIHKLQKRAARVITDSPYRTPSAPLVEQLRWLSLPDRVKYRKALLVFKSLNGLAPDYMCEHFESVQMVSSRNTRSNARYDLYVPRARTQLFQITLTIYGANIWNKLSTAIRSCNSVADFFLMCIHEINLSLTFLS